MKNNKKGFIAIIALAIFMLLAGFGTMMARTSINILNNIGDAKKQYKAEDIANGVFEYVRYEMGQHDAGWNDDFICEMGTGQDCTEIVDLLGNDDDKSGINVDIQVKGRNTEESFSSTEITGGTILDAGAAYTVPTPGEGTAGERCAQYTPTTASNACVSSSAHVAGTSCASTCTDANSDHICDNSDQTIDQINYSCNWNKLSFGSSGTARVVIPLYYENTTYTLGGGVVNPFHKVFNNGAAISDYALRVRTPCLPCAESGVTPGEDERTCALNQDETICADDEHYKFDGWDTTTEEVDSEVMKWQVRGICDPDYDIEVPVISTVLEDYTEACGFLPVVSYKDNGDNNVFPKHSAITEFRVAYSGNEDVDNNLARKDDVNFKVLYKDPLMQSQNSKVGGESEKLFYVDDFDPTVITGVLARVYKPSLILKLENPLISKNGSVIPYLEYQFVTMGAPVSDSKTTTTAKVTVNGSTIEKIMTIDNQSQLIDFAVQN